jgi:peptide/nickel transport system permease protein
MGEAVIDALPAGQKKNHIRFRNPLDLAASAAAAWLALVVLLASIAPWLPIPGPDEMNLLSMLVPPSAEYWLGADSLGRDILSRAIYGARISLWVGLGSVALGLFAGGVLGILAGYYRGWLDTLLMGLMNIMLAFPSLVLAIALIGYLGASILNVIVAIGMLFVPAFARIARANTLTFRQREFVLVAKALGASDFRILFREILPNLVGPLVAYSLVMFAVAVLAEASLGFLGLSVPPPAPSWGGMISSERSSMDEAFHTLLMPGLVMFSTVVALNVLGERAQRLFDVRESVL